MPVQQLKDYLDEANVEYMCRPTLRLAANRPPCEDCR